jgi:toxin HigB-1
MIVSFRHKGLQRFFEADDPRKLPSQMIERIRDILTALDGVRAIEELERPSFRLHPLKGDLKGYWAIAVRANWRIVFRIDGSDVSDVDFVDYH